IYALADFSSALSGVVATFYMQSGNPASFVGLELDAIASVVIGGTLLTGGVGFIPGTLMGVLIQTLINFNGTPEQLVDEDRDRGVVVDFHCPAEGDFEKSSNAVVGDAAF